MAYEIVLGPRVRKSPYFDATVKAGVTAFTIYNHMYMPISYGDSQAEYWRLIKEVSMWDVAGERQVEIAGPDATAMTRYLTPRDLSRFSVGQIKYLPICDYQGRLINDPVLLKLAEDRYWFSIADKDLLIWARAIAAERGYDVEVCEPDVSPLAVQGPRAEDVVAALFGDEAREIKFFWFKELELDGIPMVAARCGWSKQGGFELFLQDGSRGMELWNRVVEAGKEFGIGPGTPTYVERVESGLLSFGGDTEPDSTPFEVGLGKYVALDREDDYVGKSSLLEAHRRGPGRRQVGLFIEGDALPANENPWPVRQGQDKVGLATAVAYSLRLERNIAMALVDSKVPLGADVILQTAVGDRTATITEIPFC